MTEAEITFEHGGFVRLVDKMIMPADLKVVNAARISMGKVTDEMRPRDERLIRYLADHEHTTPFRHSYATFHIKAPIFVMRQWQKHQVGCSFNEISGRYVEFRADDMWRPCPSDWREGADNVKQGSGGAIDERLGSIVSNVYDEAIESAYHAYESLIALGVCREQARTVLPLSLHSECWWTASMQAVQHFLRLRLDSHAQSEIREYAAAVKTLVGEHIEGADLILEALNKAQSEGH